MDNVRLSICIPTYNFGEFIGETLESIISQSTNEVEIVVGDGASSDATAEVVRRYQSQFSRLTYCNFGKKNGIDLDLSMTVELAKGDYCWLMSSDDVLKSGAIPRMLDEIRSGHDVYLLNRTMCDRNLKPIRRKKLWLSSGIPDRVYDFSIKSELIAYLNASKSIGALFSYLSSIVVRRNKWVEVGYDERFTGSNYAHVFRLFSALKTGGGNLKYLREFPILCRGGNDSFLGKGLANRLRIDLDGYWLLGESLFPDEDIRDAFKAVMRRQHKWYMLPSVKSEVDDDHSWKEVENRLSDYGYSSAQLLLIKMLGTLKPLLRSLLSVKRLLRI